MKMKTPKFQLAFTFCNKCKKSYLIGIDGKDIRKSKTSGGGEFQETPYLAIGNNEIDDAPKLNLKKKIACNNCGNLCKIDLK